jgi:hypothetical protein
MLSGRDFGKPLRLSMCKAAEERAKVSSAFREIAAEHGIV